MSYLAVVIIISLVCAFSLLEWLITTSYSAFLSHFGQCAVLLLVLGNANIYLVFACHFLFLCRPEIGSDVQLPLFSM